MKYTLTIEYDKHRDWAYENEISSKPTHVINNLAWNGIDTTKYCPAEVEIEYTIKDTGSNRHPYGSTSAIEHQRDEVWSAEVDRKEVEVPQWLEDELLEHAKEIY